VELLPAHDQERVDRPVEPLDCSDRSYCRVVRARCDDDARGGRGCRYGAHAGEVDACSEGPQGTPRVAAMQGVALFHDVAVEGQCDERDGNCAGVDAKNQLAACRAAVSIIHRGSILLMQWCKTPTGGWRRLVFAASNADFQ